MAKLREAMILALVISVGGTALAGPPLLRVGFEHIERDGRYGGGTVVNQPFYQRGSSTIEHSRHGDEAVLEPTAQKDRWQAVGAASSAVVEHDHGAPDGSEHALLFGREPAAVERFFEAEHTVVWVDGWRRGAGAQTLTKSDYPSAEEGVIAAAIVHFSDANGLELLDGDGAGGGEIVSGNVALGGANADTWMRVTLRVDYTSGTWDCYVNQRKVNANPLGFRDTAAKPTAFRVSEGIPDAAVDAIHAVNALDGDANVDGVLDVADVERAKAFMTFDADTYDLIGASNVAAAGTTDKDGNLVVTQADLERLLDLIASGTGSQPSR